MAALSENDTSGVVILLVDDDPADQELTRRALERGPPATELRTVGDGEQALDYLLQRNEFCRTGAAPSPHLILLDLNMPRAGGHDFLAELRSYPQFRYIPVVVLTTSVSEEEVCRSYDLGCSSYVQKPVEVRQFVDAIRELRHYWLELVTLPAAETLPAVE